jgi:peptidyl-prolyl cis-trans isomerase SurA
MTELLYRRAWRRACVAAWAGALLLSSLGAAAQGRVVVRNGDFIVAVVNQELVTAAEVDQRLERAREAATRAGQRLPPEAELRQQIIDALIEERVVITHARENGPKVDEPELDRAVQNVAAQNQLSLAQLRERLREEGLDYARFRAQLRDQIQVERVREREVNQRIRISDTELDRWVDQLRAQAQADNELNIAQILVSVPDGAAEAVVSERRARAERALARVLAGEPFDRVAKELSEDSNKEQGGVIGLRPVSRLPDLFVDAVRPLKVGDVVPAPVRSGAGFHVLKLLERRDGAALRVTQTRARHILLRTSERVSNEAAARQLTEYRRQIEARSASFEDLARAHSEDGSAAGGGDLGWASPGTFVPEFEEAMNRLPLGGISAPVVSRFGVHLIQVMERRDVQQETRALRDQGRSVLREKKFEEAYTDWTRDLRARAYIEMREPPI